MRIHPVIEQVTARLADRSNHSHQQWLRRCKRTAEQHPPRKRLSCGNLAHASAVYPAQDKQRLTHLTHTHLGVVSAYNEMLSAHQPYAKYPDQIREFAGTRGATTQLAGGVPAMCDGITQGQPGMELSLFSRDVVAMATAIAMSHNMFDAHLLLGICDKIVPGQLIGALQFGHIPALFIPSGPMGSGISNSQKAKVRELFAAGEASKEELFQAETASYHSHGTCTFYGTANTNQLVLEALGLQLPGSSFLPPDSEIRLALTRAAVELMVDHSRLAAHPLPLYKVVTPESIINAVVTLLATGGSTNHTIHLIAMSESAGLKLTWQDMEDLSKAVPLLTRMYPNGKGDVNDFQNEGGSARLFSELTNAGLLNQNVIHSLGTGMKAYTKQPILNDEGGVDWIEPDQKSYLTNGQNVFSNVGKPFAKSGGLKVLKGNLGEAVIKVSAVDPERLVVEAPCLVFESQQDFLDAFNRKELFRDVVVVMRFQGPAANGMPELHKLTPFLAICQNLGHSVALVTDGRMSGASGKVPAAIHLCPEASRAGPIAYLQDHDVIRLDARLGHLNVSNHDQVMKRTPAQPSERIQDLGTGLFGIARKQVSQANEGASFLFGGGL